MGNESSKNVNKTSIKNRTLIPLTEQSCWQLFNGVNEQRASDPTKTSKAISIFISKQQFLTECRRSIQFLKTIRHPNILKFLLSFKQQVDNDSFISECVHPLNSKLKLLNTTRLCLGLHQIANALEFLHDKASISHNNVYLQSLFVSLNGNWKLSNFECACRYDSLTKEYLNSLKLIRFEDCIAPEENESTPLESQYYYAIDSYGFGTFIDYLLTIIKVDGALNKTLTELKTSLVEEDPSQRPTCSMLLRSSLFESNYIKVVDLLDRLPIVEEGNLSNAVDSISSAIEQLDVDCFNELLINRLLSPFLFLCPITRQRIIPRILKPKHHDENEQNAIIPFKKYKEYALPLIVDLFSYHLACIRETLLEHFTFYSHLIDQTTLTATVLPQLVYGLKDTNDNICTLTLLALASLIPVLGSATVVGGTRLQIFMDKPPKEKMEMSSTQKSMSTIDISKIIENTTLNQSKFTRTKQNGTKEKHFPINNNQTSLLNELDKSPTIATSHNPTEESQPITDSEEPIVKENVIKNGEMENDEDDGEWSEWEQPQENDDESPQQPTVLSTIKNDYSLTLDPIVILPVKDNLLKNSRIQRKWDPNAPLGSDYEIKSINKKKSSTSDDTNQMMSSINDDDLFREMNLIPNVQTKELLGQLETMFNIQNNGTEQIASTTIITPVMNNGYSKKFVIHEEVNVDSSGDNQENNWDE